MLVMTEKILRNGGVLSPGSPCRDSNKKDAKQNSRFRASLREVKTHRVEPQRPT